MRAVGRAALWVCTAIVISLSSLARADEATAAAPETSLAPSEPAAPPPAAPYSLPWQLRAIGAATSVRSDTTSAFYEDVAGEAGHTVASMLSASYKVTPAIAAFVRAGLSANSPPDDSLAESGKSLTNPLLGATYFMPLNDAWRLG